MKKRLRKKRHLSEFKELGFDISFDVAIKRDSETPPHMKIGSHISQVNAQLYAFIDYAEAHYMSCGGGGKLNNSVEKYNMFVTREPKSPKRKSSGLRPPRMLPPLAQADIDAMKSFLHESLHATNIVATPLVDAWHGPFPA